MQRLVLLWFLGMQSCRQIDEKELLLDSMEGGAGGPAAWWSLGASLAAKISCHEERGHSHDCGCVVELEGRSRQCVMSHAVSRAGKWTDHKRVCSFFF